jgi:hypothetical protein
MRVVDSSFKTTCPVNRTTSERSPVGLLCLMLVAVLLTGCSVLQAVYSQAPRYVQWRTNVAHHFSAEQYSLAKAATQRWFDWHRHVQMPLMAPLLAQAADDVKGPISPALACERRDAYLVITKQAVAQAAPLAAEVMVRLGPAQLARVQAFFRDTNDTFREKYVSDDPPTQAALAVDFLATWGGLVYGDLSDAQRARLTREVMALPFNARTILQEFQRFQGQYVQLLRDAQAQALTSDEVARRLEALVLEGIDPQEPQRQAQMQRWVKAGCAFASTFQAQTTPEQRARASRTLAGWQRDVLAIVASR